MKVKFIYSYPYEDNILRAMKKDEEYPLAESKARFDAAIAELEPAWRNIEEEYVKELERVSGLKFKHDVLCYLPTIDLINPMSNPLTIGLYTPRGRRGSDEFLSMLMHELVHTLLKQNDDPSLSAKKVSSLWPDEPTLTQNHILVYALLKLAGKVTGPYLALEESRIRKAAANGNERSKQYLRAIELASSAPANVLEQLRLVRT